MASRGDDQRTAETVDWATAHDLWLAARLEAARLRGQLEGYQRREQLVRMAATAYLGGPGHAEAREILAILDGEGLGR